MVKVKYVGIKPIKTDNVAMTKTVWIGQGDVQEVDEATWVKLSKHPDIWVKDESNHSPSLADIVDKADVIVNAPVTISDIAARKKPGPKPKVK